MNVAEYLNNLIFNFQDRRDDLILDEGKTNLHQILDELYRSVNLFLDPLKSRKHIFFAVLPNEAERKCYDLERRRNDASDELECNAYCVFDLIKDTLSNVNTPASVSIL